MAEENKYLPAAERKSAFSSDQPSGFTAADRQKFNTSGALKGAGSGASTGAAIGSVIPGIGTAVGAVVGAVVGGVAGGLSGRKRKEDPMVTAAKNMSAVYQDYTPMDAEGRGYDVYDYEQAGELDPELEEAIRQEESQLAGIEEDPRLRDSQMSAINAMREQAYGAISPEDLEAINQTRIQEEVQSDADMQAALQQRAMRGRLSDSDRRAAEAAQAQQQAGGAEQRGRALASMRDQARMQGLSNLNTMSQAMRGQEYGQQADRAQAQDLINQFNLQQQSGVQQRNVQSKNIAKGTNLQVKQDIADRNVANQEERNRSAMQANLDAKRAVLDKNLNAAGKSQLGGDAGMAYDNARDQASANRAAGIVSTAGLVKDAFGAFGKKEEDKS